MSDKKIFTVPSLLNTISFTKDRGLRLGYITQELTEEERIIIQRFHGSFGHMAFSANMVQDKDMPKYDAEDRTKTPSKRLRATLFRYWQQTNLGGDFNVFYRVHMEKLIDRIKRELD